MLLALLAFAPVIAVFIFASYQDDKAKFKKGTLWILGIGVIFFIGISIFNYSQNARFENEKFGKNYNAIRLQAGIDTIPASWTLKNPQIKNWFDKFKQIDPDYTLRYLNPDSAMNPVHLEKVIWVEDNRIKAEADYYRNNEQSLEAYFNYKQDYSRKAYFHHNNKGGDYSPSQTDSILSAWMQK